MRHYWAGLLLLMLAAPVSAQDLKVGLARVVITPTEPVWLSGYSGRTRPAEGKVHDLFAKAIAFEDKASTRLVLVTLDLGSISEHITESVAARCQQRYQLPRAGLILNVSHTHCAPEVAAEREVFHSLTAEEEGKLKKYITALQDQLVDLVGAALKDLQAAKVSYGAASADFASNRRLPTEKGYINSQNPDGVTDRSVPVLRIEREGQLAGLVFGYACHNTTLAFQKFCGDYAGFAQADLEARHPGITALFMMGCGGDQNPYPRHGPRGLDHAKQHGKSLADAVEKALAGTMLPVRGPLKLAYAVASLDLEPLPPVARLKAEAEGQPGLAQRKARYLLAQLEAKKQIELKQRCPLHAVRFGDDLLFLAIGGETVVDYSLLAKKFFGDRAKAIWMAGYCDDVFAYLPSLRVLREGGYEGREGILHQLTPTAFTVNVERYVIETLGKLIGDVSRK
jgi:neutral ceramidase